MLQISVASLEKDIKWRKSLILPTFSVSRMYFFELYFNLLVISVVSEWIYVNTEVTDISYLHQNNFFQKNLVKEHTEVPNLCGKSLILTTLTKISSKKSKGSVCNFANIQQVLSIRKKSKMKIGKSTDNSRYIYRQ